MGNALCLSGTIKGEVFDGNAYSFVKNNMCKYVKIQLCEQLKAHKNLKFPRVVSCVNFQFYVAFIHLHYL